MSDEVKNETTEAEQNQDIKDVDVYLKSGVHIGSKFKTGDMREYIYKSRQDGLHVLDVKKIEERINLAAKLLSNYSPEEVLVVSGRLYGKDAIKKFSKLTGFKFMEKRFVPGSLTNPRIREFTEPKILVVTDPIADKQAVKEATQQRIPIIAVCDTNNLVKNVDLVIPANNKGRKSIALIYWVLTKEIMKIKGLTDDESFSSTVEDFEWKPL
ncbi:MAG: 30S ribosomal protein S2 [Candidatus Diapherotrites archaeon]|nr:30S ribosomal protein S2 [Candidatus Diapherotrites archaeon]